MNIYTPTWLYIKQHNVTGKKYFGKTIRPNVETYKGSGVYWTRHLKEHGNDVSTIWCQLFYTKESLTEYAIKFSIENDIVNSDEWANLKLEDGLMGGRQPLEVRQKMSESHKGKKHTDAYKQRMREINLGKKMSVEARQKLSVAKTGWIKPPVTDETKKKMSESNLKRPIITCPHCNKSSRANMKRYHFDNCKENK